MNPVSTAAPPVRDRLGLAPRRGMRAFIWDLADEGLDNVLDRMVSSGIDGLYLDLIHHGGRFYCPHNPRHAIVHALDGASYFRPAFECYEKITPYLHPEYGSGAFLGKAMEAVREFGLAFTATVSLFNNRTISFAHSDCTCVNALGDLMQGMLCPANPAVRIYAQALVEDLTHHLGVETVELRDYAYLSHETFRGPSECGISISPSLGYLMSLCFCPHCRARAEEANIDADELERRVEMMIRAGLAGDLTGRRIADEISDPYHPVSRFAAMRGEVVRGLIDDMRDAVNGCGADLQLILDEEPNDAWRWGVELADMSRRDLCATLSPGRARMDPAAFLARYSEVLGLGERAIAEIDLADLHADSDEKLRDTLEAALAADIDHFVFAHYGLIRLDMLEWVEAMARRQ